MSMDVQREVKLNDQLKQWHRLINIYFPLKVLRQSTSYYETREVFLRKNIVAVSFFQNCAIHPYSEYISFH